MVAFLTFPFTNLVLATFCFLHCRFVSGTGQTDNSTVQTDNSTVHISVLSGSYLQLNCSAVGTNVSMLWLHGGGVVKEDSVMWVGGG